MWVAAPRASKRIGSPGITRNRKKLNASTKARVASACSVLRARYFLPPLASLLTASEPRDPSSGFFLLSTPAREDDEPDHRDRDDPEDDPKGGRDPRGRAALSCCQGLQSLVLVPPTEQVGPTVGGFGLPPREPIRPVRLKVVGVVQHDLRDLVVDELLHLLDVRDPRRVIQQG